jgi:RND family efflux transporter MFP subunit
MKKLLLLFVPVLLLLLGWLLYRQRNTPPEVPFARVLRETVVSTLVTNGKVEPYEWRAVRAERSGVVEAFHAARGARVKQGDLLAELGAGDARAELGAAEARAAQARAELGLLEGGGRSSELAALGGEIERARLELDAARKEQAALERLVARQAATRLEAAEAARRVERAELQLRDLNRRRAALVDPADRTAAAARLREAEAAVDLARQRLAKALIRAPISGIVYDTELRPGTFLNPGDEVAKVGRIDKVRIRVYVDEPELGRVAPGMPVAITWDALPDRRWQGTVERMPAEIVSLGTRQVGEVICVIGNPGGELIPGTNINAEIRSRVAENALSIPREALRRRGGQVGVFLLQGERVAWRSIVAGVSSVTRTQVTEGLAEGDSVALATDASLADGAAVRPVFR